MRALGVIVVKCRARLSVGRCIVCILARLLSIYIVVRYQQQGRSGGSIIPTTGSYFVGKSVRNLISGSHAYRYDRYHNSRRSGAISLLIVYGSTMPALDKLQA